MGIYTRVIPPARRRVVRRSAIQTARASGTASVARPSPFVPPIAKAAPRKKVRRIKAKATGTANVGPKQVIKTPQGYELHINRPLLPDVHAAITPAGARRVLAGGKLGADGLDLNRTEKLVASVKAKSPAVKVLQQTTRPLHAEVAYVKAINKGKGPLSALPAAWEGAKHGKDSVSDLLPKSWSPTAKSTVGFIGDVALDPVTYVTLGAGSIGKKAILSAGEQAALKAQKAGMSEAGQATVRRAAEKRAARELGPKATSRGVAVKFAGKELPGVAKTTAAIARGIGKAAKPTKPVRVKLRAAASEAHAWVRPPGASREATAELKGASREARAQKSQAAFAAQQRALRVHSQVPPADQQKVIDAIEANKIRSLPDHLHKPAVQIRDDLRHARRLERQSGVPTPKLGQMPTRLEHPEPRHPTNGQAPSLQGPTLPPSERAVREAAREIELPPPPAGTKTHRGVYYFADRTTAHAYAKRHGLPTDRISEYGRGWGVQLGRSGDYAGPGRHKVGDFGEGTAPAPTVAPPVAPTRPVARRLTAKTVRDKRPAGEAKGYIPHAPVNVEEAQTLMHQAQQVATKRGQGPGFTQSRSFRQPLAQIRESDPGLFREDLPAIHGERLREGENAAVNARFNRELGKVGKPIRSKVPGEPPKKVDIGPEDGLFHIVGSKKPRYLDPVKDREEIHAVLMGKGRNGQYLVANKAAVEHAIQSIQPLERGTIGSGWDKIQGGWKFVATATPGFHLRNLYGDTTQAWLQQPLRQLVPNLGHSARVLVRRSKQERALATGERLAPTTKGVKGVGTYDEIAREAAGHGGMRSGYVGREISDQLGPTKTTVGKVRRVARGAKNLAVNREDLARVATYIAHRKKGATGREAADRVAKLHVDYGDLTSYERKIFRRIAPFYTWSSRNIPIQIRQLATTPGKFATLGKAYEEIFKAAGVQPGDLTEWDQRQLAIPVAGSLRNFSPPTTDLSTVPTTTNPAKYGEELGLRAAQVVGPLKIPAELLANKNIAFRDDIESGDAPLVPAPAWAAHLPEGLKKALWVGPGIDKRSGKRILMWRGKADYLIKQAPGVVAVANNLMTQSNRKSQSFEQKTGGALFGVKSYPLGKEYFQTSEINRLYDQRGQLEKRRAALGQRGVGSKQTGKRETPEYRKIQTQIRTLNERIYKLKSQRGDKVLPKVGKPKKVRRYAPSASYGSKYGPSLKY